MKKMKEPRDKPASIKERLDQLEDRLESKMLKQTRREQQDVEVLFAISLKSRTVSKDWDKVQANLAKTLRSILSNTDRHFRIVIAGHEKPTIQELDHEKVIWLPVDFPPPLDTGHFSPDKIRKRREIGAFLRREGYSGYFMPLDADDWLHYRFVEYIRSHPITDAFILNEGMMINVTSEEIWLRKGFYRGCGSSAVFYFRNEDFPPTPSREDTQKSHFVLAVTDHKTVGNRMQEMGKTLRIVKFPLAAWVLGHGDNNSVLKGKKDNGVSAKDYHTSGEHLEEWFYHYFRVNP